MPQMVFTALGKVVKTLFIAEILLQILVQGLKTRARANMTMDSVSLALMKELSERLELRDSKHGGKCHTEKQTEFYFTIQVGNLAKAFQ